MNVPKEHFFNMIKLFMIEYNVMQLTTSGKVPNHSFLEFLRNKVVSLLILTQCYFQGQCLVSYLHPLWGMLEKKQIKLYLSIFRKWKHLSALSEISLKTWRNENFPYFFWSDLKTLTY